MNACTTNIVSGAMNGIECNGGRWSGMDVSEAHECGFVCPHAPCRKKAVILAQHNDKQDLALPCACTATGGLSLAEPQLKLALKF